MDDRMKREYEPDDPRVRHENGQGEHEGGPHSPEEFDVMNPARQKPGKDDDAQEQL
ncbi:hypothetical protein PY32053_03768 (plasmid) [Paracoccus yeei]|uniref:Uncharacterized protein n=1 Tax=Paracoccus yeei TaxID=147645 RepID=A0A386URI8_9RHOB|nr:hypothetical protein [Paracoccus yeei]AYF03313.1 hypothetical protein PY32053_03768 [Paracoccus yeei]